jgi:hypothetical protein
MRVNGYRPTNLWLRRELDASWHRWLLRLAVFSALAAVVLAAFVGPRQSALRLRYRIARLDDEVDRLAERNRHLQLELAALTSVPTLTAELPALGLAPVAPDQVAFLTPDGRLLRPPTGRPASREGAPK